MLFINWDLSFFTLCPIVKLTANTVKKKKVGVFICFWFMCLQYMENKKKFKLLLINLRCYDINTILQMALKGTYDRKYTIVKSPTPL